MNLIAKILAIGLIGIVLTTKVSAVVNDTLVQSYHAMLSRNAFGLKEKQSDPFITVTATPALPNIKLSGITTYLPKKAYFIVPNATNATMSFYPCIAEGQQELAIQVVKINETEGSVKIRYNGAEMHLNLKANGNTPSSVMLTGATAQPLVAPFVGGGAQPAGTVPPPTTFIGGVPQTTHPPIVPNQPTSMFNPNGNQPIPARPRREQPTVASEQVVLEQTVKMEVNRAIFQDRPPLPPTDLSEATTQ